MLGSALADAETALPPAAAEIAAIGEAYVAAFNEGDAKTVSGFWLADGDYTNLSGTRYSGREKIAQLFQNYFADAKGGRLTIDSESLRFIGPDLAIEDGTSTVTPAKSGPPGSARFSNTFVRRDGKWFLASVRESALVPADRSAELGPLSWILGDWQAQSKSGEKILLSADVGPKGNFLVLRRVILAGDAPVGGGVEWIAWDASRNVIRSWSFDDDGGFGESVWTPREGGWTVESNHTLRNGAKLADAQSLTLNKDGSVTVKALKTSSNDQTPPSPEDLIFSRPKAN